jgi:hypothetical protein
MQTLHVELGERRYPIFIGSQLDPKQLLEPYSLYFSPSGKIQVATVLPKLFKAS